MNNLDEVSLSQLSTPILRTLADGVVTALLPLEAADSFINRNCKALKTVQSTISVISSIPAGSSFAGVIKSTDSEMDDELRLSRRVLQTAADSAKYEPLKAEAAEKLLTIYAKRSDKLYSGGLQEQGAEVTDFLAEIMVPALAETRKTTGVEAILNSIAEDFKHLKELITARGSEESAPSTINEQKALLRFRLDSILTYVNTNIADKVDGFAAVEGPINAAITLAMNTYKAKTTRKENAAEEAKAVPAS